MCQLWEKMPAVLQSRMAQEYGSNQVLSESGRDSAPSLPYAGSSETVHNVSAPLGDRGTSAITLKSGNTMTVSWEESSENDLWLPFRIDSLWALSCVNNPAGGPPSSVFFPLWNFSFAVLKNAARVPLSSVTSLAQSDFPVEIKTYDRLSRWELQSHCKGACLTSIRFHRAQHLRIHVNRQPPREIVVICNSALDQRN